MDFIGTNDPTEIILEMISAITDSYISIYDFDGASSLFFHTSTSIRTDFEL